METAMTTVQITLTEDQILQAIQQLPPAQKRRALLALAEQAQRNRPARLAFAEQQIRRWAQERGLDWDNLDEAAREALIDDIVHEDRRA
jgi:hypothetical protein